MECPVESCPAEYAQPRWGGSLRPDSLQGTKVPICGWSVEGRGIGPKSSPQCRSPACSSQMAGYNAETGRSSNENICCELQNKTQTPNSPNRREDSLGFCSEGGEVGSWQVGADGQRPCTARISTPGWDPVSSPGHAPNPGCGHPAMSWAGIPRRPSGTPQPEPRTKHLFCPHPRLQLHCPPQGLAHHGQGCFTPPTKSAPSAP